MSASVGNIWKYLWNRIRSASSVEDAIHEIWGEGEVGREGGRKGGGEREGWREEGRAEGAREWGKMEKSKKPAMVNNGQREVLCH